MRSHLGPSLLLAFALHGAGIGLLAARPSPVLAAVAIPTAPLEVTILEAPRPEPVVDPAPSIVPRDEPPSPAERDEARGPSATTPRLVVAPPSSASPEPRGPEPSDAGAPDGAPGGGDGTDADRAARGRRALGNLFDGGLALQLPAPDGPTGPRAPAPGDNKANELLHEALDAHDAALGLGVGGVVASAARSAAMGPNAPSTGVAVFDAVTDQSGAIIAVHLVSSSGGAWERLPTEILGALRSEKLRVPDGSRGLEIMVRVEAKMQLPSGATSKLKQRGLGADFDLSDVAARPTRVISSLVVGQRRL